MRVAFVRLIECVAYFSGSRPMPLNALGSSPSCGCSQDGDILRRDTKLEQALIIDGQQPCEDAPLGGVIVGSKEEPTYETGPGRRYRQRRCCYVLVEPNC